MGPTTSNKTLLKSHRSSLPGKISQNHYSHMCAVLYQISLRILDLVCDELTLNQVLQNILGRAPGSQQHQTRQTFRHKLFNTYNNNILIPGNIEVLS